MLGNTKRILPTLIFVIGLICSSSFAQISNGSFAAESAVDSVVDSVVTVLLVTDGQASAVGSGLIVRADGYVLVPISLTDNSREIRIRLRSSKIYYDAKIVATDERRQLALLHVNADGLRPIPNGAIEETQVGARVFVAANPFGEFWAQSAVLNSVQLAENIKGAGQDYRVLQLDNSNVDKERTIGGLVLDESGHSLGIVNTIETFGQITAVPLSSVFGLIRSAAYNNSSGAFPIYNSSSASQNTPRPIPQNSVQMPERGVTTLAPRGPGSVVIKPSSPKEILAASKTIYVTSETVFFKPEQLINELNKRREISDWNLSFVEDRDVADLILVIDHLVFTYKFTFKIYSQRLGTIIATGDVIIFDGNLGSPDMAKRVIEKLALVRASAQKTDTDKDKKIDKKDND